MWNRTESKAVSKKAKRENARSLESAPPARKQSGKGAWKAMDRASTVAAGLVAHRLTALTWRAATGKKPPTSSRHPELGKGEAVAWAVVAGAGVELTKVLIRRATANYWVKSTGNLPPGMKPLKTADPAKEKPTEAPVEASAGKSKWRRKSQ